ncbi:MAG: DUF6483 family protein [Bacillota bacterium]|nr:DUF6483 family protein [Bacillota bacterium]
MDPTQDWLLRMIWEFANGLQSFHRKKAEAAIPRPTNSIGNDEILPEILKGMADNGQIDEAEDLLFRCVENYPRVENYEIGLEFYTHLVHKSAEELAAAGWTRQEIFDGLNDLHILIYHEPIPES